MNYEAPKQFAYIDRTKRFIRLRTPIPSTERMKACIDAVPHIAAYESVFQFPDWTGGQLTADIAKSAIIDRVFIDLDDKEYPRRAIKEAGLIATYLPGHTVNNFSGMKGAHVIIHCEPVDLLPDLKGSVLNRFAIDLCEQLELTTMDMAVTGDTNRVHRIIDTVHPGTRLHAIGLTGRELRTLSLEEITFMAQTRRGLIQRPKPSKCVTEQLQLIEERLIKERMQHLIDEEMLSTMNAYKMGLWLDEHESKMDVWNFIKTLEAEVRRIQMKKLENMPITSGGRTPEETWLLKVVEIFKTVHRAANIQPAGSLIATSASEHEARCHIVNLANDCGWTHSEISDIFSGADDYNQKVTEGQIRSIIGR